MSRSILAKSSRLLLFRPAKKLLQRRSGEQEHCLAQRNTTKYVRLHTSASTFKTYEEIFRKSIASPEKFWDEAAKNLDWFEPYSQVLDDAESPFAKWFIGGKMNTCYNALDRHVQSGHGEQLALIYDSPVANTIEKYTYQQLLEHICFG